MEQVGEVFGATYNAVPQEDEKDKKIKELEARIRELENKILQQNTGA